MGVLVFYDCNKQKPDDMDCLSFSYQSERRLYTVDSVYNGSPADYSQRRYNQEEDSNRLKLFQQQAIEKQESLISSYSLEAQQQLLAQDLAKVKNLRYVEILQADGKQLPYFELAESAGGVTEKISLVSQGSVISYLQFLCKENINTFSIKW